MGLCSSMVDLDILDPPRLQVFCGLDSVSLICTGLRQNMIRNQSFGKPGVVVVKFANYSLALHF